MKIKQIINSMFIQMYESEVASLPFLIRDSDKIRVGIFCYDAVDYKDHTLIIGYSSYLIANETDIERTTIQPFTQLKDRFKIARLPLFTRDVFSELYTRYCDMLQTAVDDWESNNSITNAEEIRELFTRIVPKESQELYRRICPEYIDFINGSVF